MLKNKTLQKGFTIVELLIVIVVIGILAALVLNTFANVQKKARDTERQTDINAIATQLEAYYAKEGNYPQYSQIDTATKAETLFPGFDADAMLPPGVDAGSIATAFISSVSDNKDEYGYQGWSDTDATWDTVCAADNACTHFTLSGFKEEGGAFTKDSLN